MSCLRHMCTTSHSAQKCHLITLIIHPRPTRWAFIFSTHIGQKMLQLIQSVTSHDIFHSISNLAIEYLSSPYQIYTFCCFIHVIFIKVSKNQMIVFTSIHYNLTPISQLYPRRPIPPILSNTTDCICRKLRKCL